MTNIRKKTYRGVQKNTNGKNWTAHLRLQVNNTILVKRIGNYPTPEEAYKARCEYLDSLK